MKPIDKAIVGMVTELPGRNESEPTCGLEKNLDPKAEPSAYGRRQHDMSRADRSDIPLPQGGRDGAVTRACSAIGETFLVPERNTLERVRPITG